VARDETACHTRSKDDGDHRRGTFKAKIGCNTKDNKGSNRIGNYHTSTNNNNRIGNYHTSTKVVTLS
jgi:hypothetical protein